MKPELWLLPLVVVVTAVRAYLSFGPTHHGWFNRTFPRRRLADLWLVAGAAVPMVLALMAWPARSGHEVRLFSFCLSLLLFNTVGLLLELSAARAGEPTWSAWKSTLPARPDR